jgi:Fur family zinc uptake transcriptional regulator
MSGSEISVAAFEAHNHKSCCGNGMAAADRLAREAGLRLTPVRRRALEILLEEHRAMGAYQVLERLAADGFGAQPPVAYRALEFLVENGLAHRIRRLNAFTACMHPGEAHAPVFFICSECDGVAEAPGAGVTDAVAVAADQIAFQVARMNVEAVGICPNCQAADGR